MKITSETHTELHPLVTSRHCIMGIDEGRERERREGLGDKDGSFYCTNFI